MIGLCAPLVRLTVDTANTTTTIGVPQANCTASACAGTLPASKGTE